MFTAALLAGLAALAVAAGSGPAPSQAPQAPDRSVTAVLAPFAGEWAPSRQACGDIYEGAFTIGRDGTLGGDEWSCVTRSATRGSSSRPTALVLDCVAAGEPAGNVRAALTLRRTALTARTGFEPLAGTFVRCPQRQPAPG
jgi:hypothetical protein